MNSVTDLIRLENEYRQLLSALGEQEKAKTKRPLLVSGLAEGARASMYVSLAEDIENEMLIVVSDEKEAMRLMNIFGECGLPAGFYPFRDLVFHDITSSHDCEYDRLAVLSGLLSGSIRVVLTTPDAALQYTIPPEILEDAGLKIAEGYDGGPEGLEEYLRKNGYVRVEMVEGVGQYAVRGGIVDFFPPRAENPYRAQFFGDEIDLLEEFDVMTQRRVGRPGTVCLTPARELLIDDEKRRGIKKALTARLSQNVSPEAETELRREREETENADELRFADKYLSLIYPEKATLLDYFSSSALIVVQEINAVVDRLRAFGFQNTENVKSLLEGGTISARYADYNLPAEDFEKIYDERITLICDNFAAGLTGRKLSGMFAFRTKQTISYADNITLLKEEFIQYLRNGFSVTLLSDSEAVAKNLFALLTEGGEEDEEEEEREKTKNRAADYLPYSPPVVLPAIGQPSTPIPRQVPRIVYGCNLPGFELTVSKSVVLSVCEYASSYSRSAKAQKKRRGAKKSAQERILSYTDLTVGDYVVHSGHGIGQYMGLETLTNDGITKDYVKIRYDGTDVLYLPTDQLDLVSKYIGAGADDGIVKLSKMGGVEWTKAKQRAKGAAKEMAKELITLYAERQRRPGIAFPPDDEMQYDFESAFEYEETDGQLVAASEIKSDMCKPCPMDRLLCGDVGFGKTEVALRAAFKAVEAGYQVALLVPTTILALQHYQTMMSRMRMYPIKIEMLSRFRSAAQQQAAIRGIRRGDVDIVVGTHRLVSDDVQFKKLGLVIVDEEQRFGVAHKEKLKKLASNVDVLTLTATPIPRTLNMAMSGIRDMSILEEAPGDRVPVQTYVLEHDDVILAEALRRELRRGGQVFWLHNRVETIAQTAAKVRAMAPDAKVAFAHGKMDKEELSDIWKDMLEGNIDVLVSTTIIETGVDVPNANTLIIEHADRMGLSQLHQIRGRIGRSNRRAYAYLTYPKGYMMNEIAEKRLSAIRDYSEFGSGFKVALRDLEIRGAGNLLGAEQHGHIEGIGYDLYMKLLNDAILEEKGQTPEVKKECTVEMKVSAYLPERYIKTSAARIEMYKKIASIENEDDFDDISDELMDRYGCGDDGRLPREADNLLFISLIRALGSRCGMRKIEQNGSSVIMRADGRPELSVWAVLASENRTKVTVNLSSDPYLQYRFGKGEEPLPFVASLLGSYLKIKAENEKNANQQ